MTFSKKQVAKRIQQVVDERFGGVARRLAIAAGLGPTSLQKYLMAKSTPGGEMAVRIADAAGVSVQWLLTGEECETTRSLKLEITNEQRFWLEIGERVHAQIDPDNTLIDTIIGVLEVAGIRAREIAKRYGLD